jgi:hypothetical protein
VNAADDAISRGDGAFAGFLGTVKNVLQERNEMTLWGDHPIKFLACPDYVDAIDGKFVYQCLFAVF